MKHVSSHLHGLVRVVESHIFTDLVPRPSAVVLLILMTYSLTSYLSSSCFSLCVVCVASSGMYEITEVEKYNSYEISTFTFVSRSFDGEDRGRESAAPGLQRLFIQLQERASSSGTPGNLPILFPPEYRIALDDT